MLLIDHHLELGPWVTIIGVIRGMTFVVKKTPNGSRHFVKQRGAWRSIRGPDFHAYVPSGRADVRIFECQSLHGEWAEWRLSTLVWDPTIN